ncbi:formylglycine-generating enzyme family protein [Pseudoduganella albidiflava]|uniref:Formylglycine-generating enzyme family protein n=1 Tax=Pseudoduganella albidiflava TaxID=321983 RepID=A0ABX5RSH3_9BURK|nr:formylglycine-generating enzyme family protein [Pseudoduganella albidiflava]QBI00844.1 formylglycine-generating enzyme family protein [Pseudoduganella albidiflava]
MTTKPTTPATPAKPCCAASRAGSGIAAVSEQPSSPSLLESASAAVPPRRATVLLPAATFLMGTDYARANPGDGEGPVRPVSLSPFSIDVYPVTNADFAAFVEATGYVTEAERFGTSFVFQGQIPDERYEEVVEDTLAVAPWWCLVRGACWRAPEGPDSSIDTRMTHPVVHVSWNDAMAYAAWSGAALPTEAQWEYAARGGLEQKLYPWGDELAPRGRHLCNVWQGEFPALDTGEDGFAGTSPVDAFPPNGHGLYSVTGNTWEWCADFWDTGFSAAPSQDPQGPAQGTARVMKGGSFLCHASYCNRYRPAARTMNTPDSAASNIGFRCARPAP